MPRSPRVVVEQKLYEIVSRAREGLPLPPTATTNELLLGIFGRTQRDDKVTLCNLVWMNNHAHIHVLPSKAEDLPRFYCELQKKLTDSLRALLGRKSLRLWEDRTGVILVDGLEDAIDRLVYLFCNPAKVGLVDTIDQYPGISSWSAFCSCSPSVDAEISIETRWHPVQSVPALSNSLSLSPKDDASTCEHLKACPHAVKHILTLKPLAWLKVYGITDSESIERIRKRIIQRVRQKEAAYREQRTINGLKVVGSAQLCRQRYLAEHRPRNKSRKIFLICSSAERRISLLATFKGIFRRCRECYQSVKKGVEALWPRGTFVPWLPPNSCYSLIC